MGVSYRLAIDLGACWMGWCTLGLTEEGQVGPIRRIGVCELPGSRRLGTGRGAPARVWLAGTVDPLPDYDFTPPFAAAGRLAEPADGAVRAVRELVNALFAADGPAEEIFLRLAPGLDADPGSAAAAENAPADAARDDPAGVRTLRMLGREPDDQSLLRLRLWEELIPDEFLNRRCVYSGRPITLEQLFTPSVAIDHILPFGRSLDDGEDNKIVALAEARRDKGNRSPYEAFHAGRDGYDWHAILARAAALAADKSQRFAEDAMARFADQTAVIDGVLTAGGMLSASMRGYLELAGNPRSVLVHDGRLTGLLARCWALDRLLQRHSSGADCRLHALDAVIVALTDRPLLRRLCRAASDSPAGWSDTLFHPWPTFQNDVRNRLAGVLPAAAGHGIARSRRQLEIQQRPDGGWVARTGSGPAGAAPNPTGGGRPARRVMRVREGDLLQLGTAERRQIVRVVRWGGRNNVVWTAPAHAAGDLTTRHHDPDDPLRCEFYPINRLRALQARPLNVDILGTIRTGDPA